MHPDQIDITTGTVAALVATHLPSHAGRPIRPVTSHGTVNALFRLGDDLVLRFPLQPGTHRDDLAAEQDHARRIAGHVPVTVPEPVALGDPGHGYDNPWAAYRWIPGDTPGPHAATDTTLARDLGAFVRALHRIDTGGRTWDGRSRGGPLHTRDAYVHENLAAARHLTDTRRLARIWADSRDTPAHPGPGVWLHADLMPGNLLLRDGRLTAVIDLGAVCVGDPAVDLMPAWNLLHGPARAAYRRETGADDATWARGRGWALIQAIGALPYYADTNPGMAATARRTLGALTADTHTST